MCFYLVVLAPNNDITVSRVSLRQLTVLSWDALAMGLFAQHNYKDAKERALVALQERHDTDDCGSLPICR